MSAYLIHHHSQKNVQQLIENEIGVSFKNNPDLFLINEENDNIKISQIREIISQVAYSPVKDEFKTFILFNFEKTTIPAQNAFLKTLEEHPSYIRIILVCSKTSGILETVVSRCQIIKVKENLTDKVLPDANTGNLESDFSLITTGTHANIIELVEKYKKREDAIPFIIKLVKYFHQKCQKQPSTPLTLALEDLQICLTQLEQNSNVLLTLEHHLFTIKSRF